MASGRLSYFAFYRELGFRVGEAVSATELERSSSSGEAGVLGYLESGTPLIVVPGYQDDPLEMSANPTLGGGSVLTDGEWIWPHIAATLVARHDLAVPAEFLQHMREAGFVPRPIEIDEVRAIFSRTQGELSVTSVAHATRAQLRIMDIRERGDGYADCVARAENGGITEGCELLLDVNSGSATTGTITVESIRQRGNRLPVLTAGQTARLMLHGERAAELAVGAILVQSRRNG